ncbi:hypothetical protein J3458_002795 [Metarhizium acridum]|uniref:uncharacterized protein n=1 Tax=Metarhizium acridum TaxID=92637 RepID=UPI001C6C7C4E|nr:hypothetical protein J3458_002795 [Metarhizium acridum]
MRPLLQPAIDFFDKRADRRMQDSRICQQALGAWLLDVAQTKRWDPRLQGDKDLMMSHVSGDGRSWDTGIKDCRRSFGPVQSGSADIRFGPLMRDVVFGAEQAGLDHV